MKKLKNAILTSLFGKGWRFRLARRKFVEERVHMFWVKKNPDGSLIPDINYFVLVDSGQTVLTHPKDTHEPQWFYYLRNINALDSFWESFRLSQKKGLIFGFEPKRRL